MINKNESDLEKGVEIPQSAIIIPQSNVLRILLLEDSPTDAELNERVLRKAGIEFDSLRVDTLNGFVAALDTFRPDIILADYKLPGFDGLQALDIALKRSPDTPCIFVTGTMGEEKAVEAVKRGANDYILKDRLVRLPIAVQHALEERKTKQQHRESEERFRNISESAQDAIIMMGADQRISFWNAAAARIFGYTAAEAIGQELHALIVPAPDHTKFSQAFPHFQETGEGSIIGKVRELTALRKSGEEFPVELSVSATQLNGQWHAIGIVRNITERKRAEESLRTSQARFGTIFNQAPLGIALIDSFTGKIYEVNPRFAEIAGRTIEEMTTIDWMSITHPDDVQEDLDNMALLNARKIPGFRMDKRYLRPDGSFVWINMTIAPLWVEQNISPRHLCMIEDITERKRVELKLAEQLDELRRWQEVMLGREMRTIEVMHEVNELLAQAGQPPRYPSAEQANAAAEGSLRSSGAAPRPTEGRVSGGVPFTGEPTGVPLAGE